MRVENYLEIPIENSSYTPTEPITDKACNNQLPQFEIDFQASQFSVTSFTDDETIQEDYTFGTNGRIFKASNFPADVFAVRTNNYFFRELSQRKPDFETSFIDKLMIMNGQRSWFLSFNAKAPYQMVMLF